MNGLEFEVKIDNIENFLKPECVFYFFTSDKNFIIKKEMRELICNSLVDLDDINIEIYYGKIVSIIGPSGSGKTKIAGRLLEKCDNFEKLKSYTTKDPTSLKENEWYNYISLDEFHTMCSNEELFESTMYAGHGYGSKLTDVKEILEKGKHVVTAMDICGAMALKTNFPHVITVYIKRDRRKLIESILKKNSSIDDKVNRLISIEDEKNNEDICDYVVSFDTYDDAVNEIINILNL